MSDTTLRIPLLGAQIEITLYDIEPTVAVLYEKDIAREAIRLQHIFNIYDSTSELSLLNKHRKATVSRELLTVLRVALEYCKETNGAYDITKGKQFLERKSGKPLSEIHCDFRDISIRNKLVTLSNPDVLIDLGSIAKGYIGDALASYLKKLGIKSAYIDARGDLVFFGNHEEYIEIQHPRNPLASIHTLLLRNSAVATSGDYAQYHADYSQSHIVGKQLYSSVTVVAPSLMEADVCATCLMLLGEQTAEFINKHNIQAILVKENGEVQTHNENALCEETA